MEKIQDAANFYKACAAVKSPYQALATKNLTAIRAEYHGDQMNLLIPNLGSTSLKYQILEMPSEKLLGNGRFERVRGLSAKPSARSAPAASRVDAVAFKAVHGGPKYRGTLLIDDAVLAAIAEFLPAAPAHNAIYLAAIQAFRESLPGVPLVAAFEPEFHATIPDYAGIYGVPDAVAGGGRAQIRIPRRLAPIRGGALRPSCWAARRAW